MGVLPRPKGCRQQRLDGSLGIAQDSPAFTKWREACNAPFMTALHSHQDSPVTKTRDFDIRIWFVVTGIVAILAVNALLAALLSNYVSDKILLREGAVAQEFLQSIITAEQSAGQLFAEPRPSPQLVSFSTHVRNLHGIVRANIYAPGGLIAFSTETELTGQSFPDNEEMLAAFKGEMSAVVEEVASDGKPEHVALNRIAGQRLIEAYIPIAGADGKPAAVVEFYQMPDEAEAIIRAVRNMIWIAAAASGALLFIALYGAIDRGARQIERQRQQISSMAVLAALGQMAGAVAHSLRNPLANIQSSIEVLEAGHPAIARGTADDVRSEVQRMNQHVSELLDFARADRPEGQRVAANTLLHGTIAKALETLRRHRVDVVFEPDPAYNPVVVIDPMLFNQVFASLLSNASEAMPEGGTVAISLRPSARPDRVSIDVADTGEGIAPDLLARLPEPFLTTKTRGLGLGLSLAKNIIERFDGSLQLGKAATGGTVVTIDLPVAA
jgi:two-component system sensor histidine kinase HydH